MTDDQMRPQGESRKARSIAQLQRENVPTIAHLPWIECDPATLQALEAVARRTMVICLLAVHAEDNGMPKEILQEYLDLRGVRGDLTANERSFLANPDLSEKDRGPFTWQYEAANVLLWAMGYVDPLAPPTVYCTAQGVSAIVAPLTLQQLIDQANFRSPDEIFDASDLHFRYHWAAREAGLRGQEGPAGLIIPVCYYRHYALNWLTDNEAEWDNVDTST